MDTLVTLIANYWGIAVLAVGIGAWVVTHRKLAAQYAVGIIRTAVIAAEKRAEALVLADGPAKLAWVVDHGYNWLPAAVKMFISKPLFATLVQREYDVAIAWAEKHVTPIQLVQSV